MIDYSVKKIFSQRNDIKIIRINLKKNPDLFLELVLFYRRRSYSASLGTRSPLRPRRDDAIDLRFHVVRVHFVVRPEHEQQTKNVNSL
jgi:hypothetical protein